MTGGLQDQVTDGEKFFGIGLQPVSKAIIGSQQVPFIYEDRLNKDDFINALVELYEMTPEARRELGTAGRAWSEDLFGFDKFVQTWDDLFTSIYDKKGSFETRKDYNSYEMKVY